MGYMLAMGPCICCKRLFHFNPMRVPSSTAINGQREPVCESCMAQINRKREAMGLEPHPILPGAYEGEPDGLPDDDEFMDWL